MHRIRLPVPAKRALHQWPNRLPSCRRSQLRASSTISQRHRRSPAFLVPSSTSLVPLACGVGVGPGPPSAPRCDLRPRSCAVQAVSGSGWCARSALCAGIRIHGADAARPPAWVWAYVPLPIRAARPRNSACVPTPACRSKAGLSWRDVHDSHLDAGRTHQEIDDALSATQRRGQKLSRPASLQL